MSAHALDPAAASPTQTGSPLAPAKLFFTSPGARGSEAACLCVPT